MLTTSVIVRTMATVNPNGNEPIGIFMLPPELRRKIWRMTLPDESKVVQAKSDNCPRHTHFSSTRYNCIISFSVVQQTNPRTVPIALHICAESRATIPILPGSESERNGCGIWWNPAIDKILLDFDFDPRCLGGRTRLCRLLRHLVVGFTYGALFAITLNLHPDMQTVVAETRARGQLRDLIVQLPMMKTFWIAYPDMSRPTGHQTLMAHGREPLRADLMFMDMMASADDPTATFRAFFSMDWRMRQATNSSMIARSMFTLVFMRVVNEHRPSLDPIPGLQATIRLATRAPHLASMTPCYISHSSYVSARYALWSSELRHVVTWHPPPIQVSIINIVNGVAGLSMTPGAIQGGANGNGTNQVVAFQQNATQQNATQQTATQQNGTQQNGTQQNGTQQNGTQQTGTQQTGTQQNGTSQDTS
ncbi:Major royal jelly protein 3 [Cytospora mali]|uniref:Major royal jelly protein 3 n=1 Tax=Cytospora mali TaxID=578113 RepID=A0A194UVG1_CYTMA|nr:Major royal jelly protein 3 [Valsa mali var. pyri (nom. inval.)]